MESSKSESVLKAIVTNSQERFQKNKIDQANLGLLSFDFANILIEKILNYSAGKAYSQIIDSKLIKFQIGDLFNTIHFFDQIIDFSHDKIDNINLLASFPPVI